MVQQHHSNINSYLINIGQWWKTWLFPITSFAGYHPGSYFLRKRRPLSLSMEWYGIMLRTPETYQLAYVIIMTAGDSGVVLMTLYTIGLLRPFLMDFCFLHDIKVCEKMFFMNTYQPISKTLYLCFQIIELNLYLKHTSISCYRISFIFVFHRNCTAGVNET